MEDLTLLNIITLGFSLCKRLHFLFAVYSATEVTSLALEKMKSLLLKLLPPRPPPGDHKSRLACLVGKRDKAGAPTSLALMRLSPRGPWPVGAERGFVLLLAPVRAAPAVLFSPSSFSAFSLVLLSLELLTLSLAKD